MIYGANVRLDMESRLYNAPHLFYLTGSRYFGTARDDSDWDYFVQDDPLVHDWLSENGFFVEHESYKQDPLFTTVYKGECPATKKQYHIQVCWCAKAKQQIQFRIAQLLKAARFHGLTKDHMRKLWTWGTELYEDGIEGHKHHKIEGLRNTEKER